MSAIRSMTRPGSGGYFIPGIATLSFLMLYSTGLKAQRGFWSDLDERSLVGQGERRIIPTRYRTVAIDLDALRQYLATVPAGDVRSADHSLALPTAEGGSERFRVVASPIMAPELEAVFPDIRTYAGSSMDRPGVQVRFDVTPHGLHAMVMDPHGSDLFIDPYAFGVNDACIVYRRSDLIRQGPIPISYCAYDQVNDIEAATQQTREWIEEMGARAGDCQKRTYRLALACTGEYANYHGSNTSNNNKTFAMAAMVTTMNRVNGIYERDATLTMVLVANNQNLIYLNPGTDPYSNGNGSTMLGQNQSTCNSVIGSANYDIGHVFSTGGGGVAFLNSPCTSNKARGVTGQSMPVGDPFDIDYVAHEMGHQFGGNHTQNNNNCNRADIAAYEPGSGTSIMGYAGVCSPSVQNNSDALFHGYSLQEIAANISTGASSGCAVVTASNNLPPVVDAGVNRTIPRSTPFILTAVASDPDGDDITYSWEQMNREVSTQPPVATSTSGPNFRLYVPSTSPERYMPNLPAVIANTSPTWEVLPSVSRTLSFRVNVRDNNPLAGCTDEDDMTVTISGSSGPFLVTQPNTALSWQAGSTQTVTWNVANSNAAPVSCANVEIALSVDGGYTYPYVLLASTPNDGSQTVTLPLIPATSSARIRVKANGNIFYDISNADFTITAAPAQPSLSAKVVLDGPFDTDSGLMWDSLRVAGLLPLQEPYTALGFPQAGGGGETMPASVLLTSGANAIVDWVRIELRSGTNASNVISTRQALLQRDGDVVDVDGTSPVTFNSAAGSYHIVVRHRNHLGCMTAAPVALTGGTVALDFRSSGLVTYGTDARRTVGSIMALWSGNVLLDNVVRYTGGDNDRDLILGAIGGVIPTGSVTGYRPEDVNLDSKVRYTGERNDRDPILVNIGGTIPTSTRSEQLP